MGSLFSCFGNSKKKATNILLYNVNASELQNDFFDSLSNQKFKNDTKDKSNWCIEVEDIWGINFNFWLLYHKLEDQFFLNNISTVFIFLLENQIIEKTYNEIIEIVEKDKFSETKFIILIKKDEKREKRQIIITETCFEKERVKIFKEYETGQAKKIFDDLFYWIIK